MYSSEKLGVNMKQIVLFVHLIGLSISARLDNTYLPPQHAGSAAGNHLLTTPFQGTAINPGRYQSPHGFSTVGQTYPSTNFPHSQNRLINSVTGIQDHGSFNGPSTPYGRSSYAHGADNILRYNNHNSGDGNYVFDFETENKISQKEVGHLENAGTDRESSVVQGGYSYVAPNGQTIAVNYIADENGFRTSADGVPQSVHSQNLNRHHGGHKSGSHIPHSGFQNEQNTPFSRQNVIDYTRGQKDFYDGTGVIPLGHQNVHGFRQTGGQIGNAPFGRQNLKAAGYYGGFNQGVSAPHTKHQLSRQYLPPGNSIHSGY